MHYQHMITRYGRIRYAILGSLSIGSRVFRIHSIKRPHFNKATGFLALQDEINKPAVCYLTNYQNIEETNKL